MSSRRTLILIGAVVVGGLAAFLILSYVRGVENRSNQAGAMVDVVVVAGPIAKGTNANEAIDAKLLTMDKRRREDLPANPVRRFPDIMGQVASLDLGGGEVVTTSMFVPNTALNGSKSASLDKGNVAITISVDQAAGVAGLVQPGDSVNILARYCAIVGAGGGAAAAEGSSGCALSRAGVPAAGSGVQLGSPSSYLFQAVKVLAVGQSLGQPVAAAAPAPAAGATADTTAPPTVSPLVTLQLPPAEAQLLASLRDASLYLTLNRPDYVPVPVPFSNSLPELPGETGQSAYPPAAGPGGQ